jgi:hypothetical protein
VTNRCKFKCGFNGGEEGTRTKFNQFEANFKMLLFFKTFFGERKIAQTRERERVQERDREKIEKSEKVKERDRERERK